MRKRNGVSRWGIALAAVLVFALVYGGTAMAGKRYIKDEGWLGVFIQEVDEDIQEAWDLETDEGVIVDEVIEDSPAEKAGLKDGDVILKYNDQEVTSSGRLTRWIRKTKPETEVTLGIIRDGEPRELVATIEEREREYGYFSDDDDDEYSLRVPHPYIPPIDIPRIDIPRIRVFEDDGEHFLFLGSRGRIGLQLRELTEQLGEYFGVTDGEGALVEKVLEDSPAEKAGIKAGDVIVEIDGERIEDAGDVVEEISHFDEGDEIEITVLRQGDRREFAVEIEEDESSSKRHFLVDKYRKPSRSYRTLEWHDEADEAYEEIRGELREAMEELREELEEVREELQEALEELHGG
jgi:serine protease Do